MYGNKKQPSKLGSTPRKKSPWGTRRRDSRSAAADARLQQGPQFVLVGFVQSADYRLTGRADGHGHKIVLLRGNDLARHDLPGSQLLARAYGGDNHLGVALEFGWVDVSLTDAGRADPVLSQVPQTFPIFQWHSDTFSLPPGAVHLAQSAAAAHQAFRIGRATYGTQFHFEASRSVVRDWSDTFPDTIERMLPGWSTRHPEIAATRGAEADSHGLALARAWVGLI